MKSPDSAMSGRAVSDALDGAQIVGAGVAAVHRLEDAVGARLHRQVQVGHQLVDVAMRGEQLVVHVARMDGGVADAGEAIDLGQAAAELAEADGAAARVEAVIGVDVLARAASAPSRRRRRGSRASASTCATGRETSAPRV